MGRTKAICGREMTGTEACITHANPGSRRVTLMTLLRALNKQLTEATPFVSRYQWNPEFRSLRRAAFSVEVLSIEEARNERTG